jgi:hypothetical protein
VRVRYLFAKKERRKMSQAALAFGPTLETVPVAVEKGRPMRTAVVLDSTTTLREIPVFPGPVTSCGRPASGVRAFRVEGDELAREGFFDGDYVLVGPVQQRMRSGTLVLAEADGRPVLRPANAHGATGSEDRIPAARILGRFLGVIRRRGFADPRSVLAASASARLTPLNDCGSRAPSKVMMLRGRLGMLESTCAETRNPRLQRALRNEAERVRRQLQNETPRD